MEMMDALLFAAASWAAVVTVDIGPEDYDVDGNSYFPCHKQQTVIVNYRGEFVTKIPPGHGAKITRVRQWYAPWEKTWRVDLLTHDCLPGPHIYKSAPTP
jgi:hypothetical protein